MSTQLERARKKEAQAKAYRQKLEAAEKHKDRKKDVRRKILLGAYVLERLKAGDMHAEALRGGLDGYLTREGDRTLFGLAPLETSPRKEKREATQNAVPEIA